jgi:hemolysin III
VLLVVIWVLAISGVVVATTGVPLPRWVTVVLYIAVACTVVFFLPALADRIHASGVIVLLVGGGLYSAGAAAYALRWPRLWPYVFGYHEVFHIFVIAATAVYFVFIMDTVALSR